MPPQGESGQPSVDGDSADRGAAPSPRERAAKTALNTLIGLSALWVAALVWKSAPEWWRLSQPPPMDPAFIQLSAGEIFTLPVATRMDWPMGAENGALTYNAQKFRLNRHLGDDLNGIGGGDSDLGQAVFACGLGRVVFANHAGPGWGNMVILAHRLDEQPVPRVIQTVYAHLKEIQVRHGQLLLRGQRLGSVGNADGRYLAHLHFEVREGPFINPGVGYDDGSLNRIDPEALLGQLAPAPKDLLAPPPTGP